DVYHTKRMQRVFSVCFSTDNAYVLSGSDDGNIRLWRAQAASRARVVSARERQKLEYDAALKLRFRHMPEIRRLARPRHVPKHIKKDAQIKTVQLASAKRKDENVRKHSRRPLRCAASRSARRSFSPGSRDLHLEGCILAEPVCTTTLGHSPWAW